MTMSFFYSSSTLIFLWEPNSDSKLLRMNMELGHTSVYVSVQISKVILYLCIRE